MRKKIILSFGLIIFRDYDYVLYLLINQVPQLLLGVLVKAMLEGELSREMSSCVALIDDDALHLVVSKVYVNEEQRPCNLYFIFLFLLLLFLLINF
jgi:undecaprenyl pyrophosphate phosphatase UppP